MALELQFGFTSSFNSESFKATLIAAGESMYSALRAGMLSAANEDDLVEALGAKILADITSTIEEPTQ